MLSQIQAESSKAQAELSIRFGSRREKGGAVRERLCTGDNLL